MQSRSENTKKNNRYAENRNEEGENILFPNQKQFRGIWQGFVAKQKWDSFSCPFCRREGYPYECDKIVADGVAIGVQKHRCKFLINPKEIKEDITPFVNMGKLNATRFSLTKDDQSQMIRFVVTQCGAFQRDSKIIKMNSDECDQWLKYMNKTKHYNHFASLMVWAYAIVRDTNITQS